MSTLPQRQVGLMVTAALAVVGAIVAGAILFTSGTASDVELTTARLVPEDASFYFALNTDLSSDQWVAAFKLIERLGQDDPQGKLEDSANDAGVDWESEVVPFLGGDAAFFLRSASVSFTDVDGALIIKCTNAKDAFKVIRDQSGFDFDKEDYDGQEYYAADGLFAVILGKHLVLATSEEVLFEVIDTSKGKNKNLTDVQDFKTLRDELSKNFLAFFYIDSGSLFGDFLDSGGGIMRTALEEAGVADIALKPHAFAFGAKKNSFEAQSASLGKPGAVGPLTQPRDSRFAKVVPGETAFFFSTQNLAQTYDAIVKAAGKEINEAIREQSEFDSLDDALQSAGKELGLKSAKDIIVQLTGETAIAVWFPAEDSDEPEVAFLAEVQNESAARTIIEKMVASNARSNPKKSTIKGIDVVTFKAEDGEDVAYGFTSGYLVIGTPAALKAILDPDGPRLSETKTYSETVAAMPTKLGTFAYFDVATLVRLPEAGLPAQLDEAEKAFKGAIINFVNEREVVRSSAVITIAE